MTHSRRLIIFLLAGGAAGCGYGLKLTDFPSASGPEGVTVRLTVQRVGYLGELLETRADAFLILSSVRFEMRAGNTVESREKRVRLVPFSRINSVQFQHGSDLDGQRWPPGDAKSRERFRLLSRFPQGLTPELLQQLLKMYGQTTPEGGTP